MSTGLPDVRGSIPDRRPGRNRAGYALIEALVAFAIVAVALSVGLPFFADGLRGVGESEKRLHALSIAESRLADSIGTEPAPKGVTEGETEDGYAWRLTARPIGPEDPQVPAATEYVVEVAWPGIDLENGIRLATVRLARESKP